MYVDLGKEKQRHRPPYLPCNKCLAQLRKPVNPANFFISFFEKNLVLPFSVLETKTSHTFLLRSGPCFISPYIFKEVGHSSFLLCCSSSHVVSTASFGSHLGMPGLCISIVSGKVSASKKKNRRKVGASLSAAFGCRRLMDPFFFSPASGPRVYYIQHTCTLPRSSKFGNLPPNVVFAALYLETVESLSSPSSRIRCWFPFGVMTSFCFNIYSSACM